MNISNPFLIIGQELTRSPRCPGWAQSCDFPVLVSQSARITGVTCHSCLRRLVSKLCVSNNSAYVITDAVKPVLCRRTWVTDKNNGRFHCPLLPQIFTKYLPKIFLSSIICSILVTAMLLEHVSIRTPVLTWTGFEKDKRTEVVCQGHRILF